MKLDSLANTCDFIGFEFGTFRLKKGVSEEKMLKMAKLADQMFLSKEEGFLGHTVLKGPEGIYADVAFATTQNKAEEICGKWMDNEYTLQYIDTIDSESVNLSFWERIK